MADGLKERATSFFKMFGTELAVEFYHDGFVSLVGELFRHYDAKSLGQLINNSEPLAIPNSFIELANEYSSIIKEYDAEKLAKTIFELLCEVRPDLGATIAQADDDGAAWLLRCTMMVRDRIVNVEKYTEEVDKAQTVKITCDNCGKSLRIFRDNIKEIKLLAS